MLKLDHWRWAKQFCSYWIKFAFSGANSAVFGWATIPTAAIFVAMHLTRDQPNSSSQWTATLVYTLYGAGLGWLIGFLVNLFFLAPLKAFKSMNPFAVSIRDDILFGEFGHYKDTTGYNVIVTIKNASPVYLLDCHVHIIDIPGTQISSYPRYVTRFDLPPGETKYVTIAYWFTREAPNTDDKEIGICGPVSASFGGNIMKAPPDTTLTVRVRLPDSRSKEIRSHVWIDPHERRLRAELLK